MNFLEQNGYRCELSYILSERDDRMFYARGRYLEKLLVALKGACVRIKDVLRAPRYDAIFIHRTAFHVGPPIFERLLRWRGKRLVYDFDDAIWMLDVSDANRMLGWLKVPQKTSEIIRMADLVLAGNAYLADYAKRFNAQTFTIPTTIDTQQYTPCRIERNNGPVCIGWSGSVTTIRDFALALPFLRKLKQKYGNDVLFKVVGDASYRNDALGIRGLPWTKEGELLELASFDIGIMPLPDNEWARGKCGLKGLQYMALGIPTVMSPVGVNTDIISDGVNGFLADGVNEWVDKLSSLIDSSALRERLGKAARKTVIERYSFDAQKTRYLHCFQDLLSTIP